MTEPDPASPLWDAMQAWSRRRGVPFEALASSHTRVKIKRGEPVKDSVYRNIERLLGWRDKDARRCAVEGIPPEPVEGEADQVERLRVELMRTAGDVVIAAAGADWPALQEAKAALDEALRKLRAGG